MKSCRIPGIYRHVLKKPVLERFFLAGGGAIGVGSLGGHASSGTVNGIGSGTGSGSQQEGTGAIFVDDSDSDNASGGRRSDEASEGV